MLRREVAVSSADIARVSGYVAKLGGYALGLVDVFDLGIDRQAFQSHVDRTRDQIDMLASRHGPGTVRLQPAGYADRALLEATDLPWNYPQDLRFAAGACMISQKYRRWMSVENLQRSLTAKVLYECQGGILDDLIDKGTYRYMEAKDLYHLVLSSMTDPSLDTNAFKKRLITVLSQDQLDLFDIVASITHNFNHLFNASPHGGDLFYEMEKLDERVALGQALTMFQKDALFNLDQVARIARRFYSPLDSLRWYERLASYISGGTRFNVIDAAFVDRKFRAEKMASILKAWYYFDAVIIFLNNVGSVYQDLRAGVANLSLIAMREKELRPLHGLQSYEPELTLDDYGRHLKTLAKLAGRGLRTIAKDYRDPDQYYPFITMMMPVVMLADWIGQSDEMIHTYVEALAPSLREAAENAPRQEVKAEIPASRTVRPEAK